MPDHLKDRGYTETWVCGHLVEEDPTVGHLIIHHDGDIDWDTMQEIKNQMWGWGTAAIEVYPPKANVVNSITARHLWRLGADDFFPDLLGNPRLSKAGAVTNFTETLESRYMKAWQEAWATCPNAA